MQLTKYTDYALRVLLFLAERPQELASIAQIADAHAISRNHLMKVVRHLGQLGILDTVRGRNGGLRLAHPPHAINVGWVIRNCEETLTLGHCGDCILAPKCLLSDKLEEALCAFFAVLDRTSLADLLLPRQAA